MKADSKEITKEENEALKPSDEANKATELSPEFTDLDTGWAWVIVFASFGTFCLLGTSLYSVGIIQSVLLQRYRESVSLTSWPGAINTALMSLGGNLKVLFIIYSFMSVYKFVI